jgi:hypothetical protein
MSIDAQPSHPAVRVACIAVVAAVFLVLGQLGSRFFLGTRVPGIGSGARAGERTVFTSLSDPDARKSGFPVPESAEFVEAVGQANKQNAVMAMYRSDEMSTAAVAEFYAVEMAKRGWKEDSRIANELNRHAPGIMLFFRRKRIECLVHAEDDGIGSKWVVIFGRKIFGGGKR